MISNQESWLYDEVLNIYHKINLEGIDPQLIRGFEVNMDEGPIEGYCDGGKTYETFNDANAAARLWAEEEWKRPFHLSPTGTYRYKDCLIQVEVAQSSDIFMKWYGENIYLGNNQEP